MRAARRPKNLITKLCKCCRTWWGEWTSLLSGERLFCQLGWTRSTLRHNNAQESPQTSCWVESIQPTFFGMMPWSLKHVANMKMLERTNRMAMKMTKSGWRNYWDHRNKHDGDHASEQSAQKRKGQIVQLANKKSFSQYELGVRVLLDHLSVCLDDSRFFHWWLLLN